MRRVALRWSIGIVVVVIVIIINASHSGMTLSAGCRRTSGGSSSISSWYYWRVIPVDAVATVSKYNVILLVICRVLSYSAGCGRNRRICSHRRGGRRGGIRSGSSSSSRRGGCSTKRIVFLLAIGMSNTGGTIASRQRGFNNCVAIRIVIAVAC